MKSKAVEFVTPPKAPENLQYQDLKNKSVKLTWDTVSGAQKYRVYRFSVKIAEVSNPSWSTTYLTPGTAYNFFVTAVGEGGESKQSDWIYFTAPKE
ncbi:fibronectin type III domain-containing protein [Bacillus velezensis]|uniref:fibronectin type III domain-containing protein n=1 Tax=Bacillus velezensis TaxID=492670 RepID=UPI002FFEF61D